MNVQSAVSDLSNGLFSRLTTIGGSVVIQSNPALQTLGTAFPWVASVGGQVRAYPTDKYPPTQLSTHSLQSVPVHTTAAFPTSVSGAMMAKYHMLDH